MTTWTTHLPTLRNNAHAVLVNERSTSGLGAREVARILSGVTTTLARRHGIVAMQRACAELVLDPQAISSGFKVVPSALDGVVDPAIEMIVMVARGLFACSSPDAIRAALSFWASESDYGVLQDVVAAA